MTRLAHGKSVRRLCVAFDVEQYSGKGRSREFDTQARLSDLLEFAFTEAGLTRDGIEVTEQQHGDGGLALLPTGAGVDEPRLLARLIRGLETGLAQDNEGHAADDSRDRRPHEVERPRRLLRVLSNVKRPELFE